MVSSTVYCARLAVESWSSSYRKTSTHPLFFEWVESPMAHWKKLRQSFWKGLAFSALLFSAATFALSFTLARLQQARPEEQSLTT